MILLIKGPAHLICMWRFTCDVTSSFSFFFPLNEWIKKLHWFTVWPSATLQAQYTVLPLRLERRGRTLTGFLTQQVHELQKQWKNVNTGQRSHWAVWLACPYFVFLVQLHSLLVFSNESAFPAFKNDEKLHNACWMKNTVAIVCSTQKDGDDAPQSICLCQITIHKPGNVCFFSLFTSTPIAFFLFTTDLIQRTVRDSLLQQRLL